MVAYYLSNKRWLGGYLFSCLFFVSCMSKSAYDLSEVVDLPTGDNLVVIDGHYRFKSDQDYQDAYRAVINADAKIYLVNEALAEEYWQREAKKDLVKNNLLYSVLPTIGLAVVYWIGYHIIKDLVSSLQQRFAKYSEKHRCRRVGKVKKQVLKVVQV